MQPDEGCGSLRLTSRPASGVRYKAVEMEFAEVAGQDEDTRVSSVSRIIDKAISSQSCLVTIYGRDLGKQYTLDRPETTIGRGADNTITLDMDNVSRMHARVLQKTDGFFL